MSRSVKHSLISSYFHPGDSIRSPSHQQGLGARRSSLPNLVPSLPSRCATRRAWTKAGRVPVGSHRCAAALECSSQLECPDSANTADSRADENMTHSLMPSSESRGLSAMDGSGTKTNDDMASLSGPKLIGRSPMCTACVNEELCTANPRPQELLPCDD